MIRFDDFFHATVETGLGKYHDVFHETLKRRFASRPHGDLPQWQSALEKLPDLLTDSYEFADTVTIGKPGQISSEQSDELLEILNSFHPWRKGPWDLFGIEIDTEWRSNLKWDRIKDHITPLKGRLVLDVGCGNAYYGFRMLQQQPALVLGIDPTQLYMMQFKLFKHFVPDLPLFHLPLKDVDLPPQMAIFDTVFSMGVLYHRRAPQDHLKILKDSLKKGGELVLESLVIDADKREVLIPDDRYALMRNIWVIPSCDVLSDWLFEAGFKDVRLLDVARTTMEEQRSTKWMKFQSLKDFLDPNDPSLTIEGHPAPNRAVYVANK